MNLSRPKAEIYVPDGIAVAQALARTTHIAISAHQDDIEIMAYHGILECFGRADRWFTGVVVTNGSGSPRSGLYESCSDEDMMVIRNQEQKKAAVVGGYSAQALLDYPSGAVKSPTETIVVEELLEILKAARAQYVYTHNLADKHETHVGVAVKTLQALREMDPALRPEKVYGCEVWRNLDWMMTADKVQFDVHGRSSLENALLGVFDSQICGGKRYDLATAGRRLANATYAESHGVDETDALMLAMDLTPLLKDKTMDLYGFVEEKILAFANDVKSALSKVGGTSVG